MEEINLYDLLRFYAKKWLTIASFAIAGAIIGVIFTYYIQQPLYKSSATVLLVGTNRTSGQESVVLNNYVKLFTSRRVLTPVIDKHDYDVKMKAMHGFFEEGDKVKVTLRFRGREMAHQDLGVKVLERVKVDTAEVAKVESDWQLEGRQMVMVLAPR